MPHIKKLVIHGFKSFARETEIVLDRSMNSIVGPNGSGKSNVTDAICFVLGRLSAKSMRAAKASHLIFAGTKSAKPSTEASVSMVFDNSDKSFAFTEKEIEIKRIIRRNGQGVYKINNQVKTRQEILELLAQAGIDPNGFNIVLQGEITDLVKMGSEERRGIIEEVAGISVYETRKQRSLKELEKTDEKLKEISAILRERTSYLKNLEQERQQALKFKKLEETVKKCKASILKRKLDEKAKEQGDLEEEIKKRADSSEKVKERIRKTEEETKQLNMKVEEINSKIQQSSGVEQESLSSEIADLKAEIAGLEVRKENFQNQLSSIEKRKQELEKSIGNSEQEITEMRKTKGKSRAGDFEKKKQQLDAVEENRRKFYSYKSSLQLIEQRIDDKNRELNRAEHEAESTLERIKELEIGLHFKDNLQKNKQLLTELNKQLEDNREKQAEYEKIILDGEKLIASSSRQIEELEKIKKQVAEIDICPLCKTKITPEHIGHIETDSNEKISKLRTETEEAENKKRDSLNGKENIILEIRKINEEAENRKKDIIRLESIEEKKPYLRTLQTNLVKIGEELEKIKKDKVYLEKNILEFKNVEEEYDSLKLEVDELARHEEVDVGMEITLKQRELDRMKLIIKQSVREKSELEDSIKDITNSLENKEELVEKKDRQDVELQEKFRKMIEERNKINDKIRLFETDVLKKQNDVKLIEAEINNFKIKIAETKAQIEGVEIDFKEFENVEIIKLPEEQLRDKLEKTQAILMTIGNVNLRALEVYEDIKREYDVIAEKTERLQKEKEEILKIVEEIDMKKKRTFSRTLKDLNELFSRNFSELSTKGEAFLEPENPDDFFAGGLNIIIKVGKGKYFDVTSLSGGEQTLIALSLIFAIQEYRPYCFYIFDEIDAALDKRNSERLAMLLRKHMKSGQYLIITHNDALISESSTLYGISMQEGISKVLSLQV